jgi:hypothetical protein
MGGKSGKRSGGKDVRIKQSSEGLCCFTESERTFCHWKAERAAEARRKAQMEWAHCVYDRQQKRTHPIWMKKPLAPGRRSCHGCVKRKVGVGMSAWLKCDDGLEVAFLCVTLIKSLTASRCAFGLGRIDDHQHDRRYPSHSPPDSTPRHGLRWNRCN